MKLMDRVVLPPVIFFSAYIFLKDAAKNSYIALVVSVLIAVVLSIIAQHITNCAYIKKRRTARDSVTRARRFVRNLAIKDPSEAESLLSRLLCEEFDLQPVRFGQSSILARSKEHDALISILFVLRHPDDGPLKTQDIICALRKKAEDKAEICILACLGAGIKSYSDEELRAVRILNGDILAELFAKHPELMPVSPEESNKHRPGFCALWHAYSQPVSKRSAFLHLLYTLLLLPGWLLSKSPVLFICICFHFLFAMRAFLPYRKKPSSLF